MIMNSFRFTKKKVLAIALAAALMITGGFAINSYFLDANSVDSSKDTVVGQNAPAKTNDERLKFISQYGWEVEAEPVEVSEIVIPKEFDEVYKSYNAMQQQQGYDLSKYQNKRCKRYIYKVTNYPGETGEVQINLIVYKNKVIGGDVAAVDLQGFMHGFDIATRTSVDLLEEGVNTSTVVPNVTEDGALVTENNTAENGTVVVNPGTGSLIEEIPTTAPGTVTNDSLLPESSTPGTIVVPPGTSTPAEIIPPQTTNEGITNNDIVVLPEVVNPGTGADVPPYNAVG